MALTAKQERFCREYVIDFNATQAAIRAGYRERAAYSSGSENLKKPEIKTFLAFLMSEKNKNATRKAQDVLDDIVHIKTIALDSGDLKNALKALEMEAKHLGLFTPKTDDNDKLQKVEELLSKLGANHL